MSGGPAEGRHLEAKLAIIAQQVDERIDAIEGRRRRGARAGAAALVLLALGGGAATAAALSYPPPATVVVEVPVAVESLRCAEGADADAPAYFTARYSFPAGASDPVDRTSACGAARTVAADLDPDATPEQLLELAAQVLAESADGAELRVLHATFGALG